MGLSPNVAPRAEAQEEKALMGQEGTQEDTVEAMPSAETPAAGEKTMAAIYRTIVRLRSNHGREPVFVLAV